MHTDRIVVFGPSGAGKSAIGAALAARLDVAFLDADDLHSDANVAKMRSGIALTDLDRMPWLDSAAARLSESPAVLACSALARRYRDRIRKTVPEAVFVQLQASRAQLQERMDTREHFMPPALLDSQIDTLEPLESDERGFAVLNADAPPLVVNQIVTLLAQRFPGPLEG